MGILLLVYQYDLSMITSINNLDAKALYEGINSTIGLFQCMRIFLFLHSLLLLLSNL